MTNQATMASEGPTVHLKTDTTGKDSRNQYTNTAPDAKYAPNTILKHSS